MNVNSLSLLKNSLQATSLRQEAIASNIANVNTSDYKVNQVEFEGKLQEFQQGLSLKRTQQGHIGFESLSDVKPTLSKRTGTTIKENGNNVDADMEMANMAQNSLQYNALISQLNARYKMLNTVISG